MNVIDYDIIRWDRNISGGGVCVYIKKAIKVARYSFSGSISPKFEHKLSRHKQRL